MQPRVIAMAKSDTQINILGLEIDMTILCRNPHIDLGVTFIEIAETRDQPCQREGFKRAYLERTS